MESHHLCKAAAKGAFVRGALSQQVRLRTVGHGVGTVHPALGHFGGLLRTLLDYFLQFFSSTSIYFF